MWQIQPGFDKFWRCSYVFLKGTPAFALETLGNVLKKLKIRSKRSAQMVGSSMEGRREQKGKVKECEGENEVWTKNKSFCKYPTFIFSSQLFRFSRIELCIALIKMYFSQRCRLVDLPNHEAKPVRSLFRLDYVRTTSLPLINIPATFPRLVTFPKMVVGKSESTTLYYNSPILYPYTFANEH